ncbi:MAG: tRNA (N(6)-L-threonylcarbamoyladenosine(37)-C(2))-methylthiotransferase MtaB [Armatimonadota bacterium]
MKTFLIHTFGCKVNQYDTEELRRFLLSCGLKESKSGEVDFSFVNTCTVTHLADRKARQRIRHLAGVSEKVIVTGCGVRNPESFTGLFDNGKIVFLDNKKDDFKVRLKEILNIDFLKEIKFNQSRSRAFVKVQDGCDEFCTYCIVPYVRGVPASRSLDDVLVEVLRLEESGFKEIVITGVNLGLYGADLREKLNLKSLLEAICNSTGIERVRLSSIEVNHIDNELIDFIKAHPRICPHFHIPLQHASDRILASMKRPYNLKEYDITIKKIISKIPGAAVSTDILVGFPGEEDKDYRILYDYIKSSPFSRLHVFKYSPRPFTEAGKMKNRVPEQVKSLRSSELLELAQRKLNDYNMSFAGTVMDILVEGAVHKTGSLQGYTPNYIQVLVKKDKGLINKIISVKLYREDGIIYGRIVNGQ